MAFIVAAAIRGGVKAVQSGIQAHKDFNDPAGPQPRYDSRGNPKNPGPVYGWVMKAENKLEERKNKGTAGSSAGGTVVPREEEIDAFVVEVDPIRVSVFFGSDGSVWWGRMRQLQGRRVRKRI